jgi:hypothetical protein
VTQDLATLTRPRASLQQAVFIRDQLPFGARYAAAASYTLGGSSALEVPDAADIARPSQYTDASPRRTSRYELERAVSVPLDTIH